MVCTVCGGETRFVQQYQQHWCDRCQAYRGAAAAPPPRKGPNLWLVIGLPVGLVVVLIGVWIFMSVSAFKSYVDKSRTSEAEENLRALYRGVEAYYNEEHAAGLTVEVNRLPAQAAGPTPPLGACCEQGDGKCAPDPSLWLDPTWQALMFEVNQPHYFSYEYAPDEDGKSFAVSAYGDLDCDGNYSTYRMFGTIKDDMLMGSGAVSKIDALE